MKIPFAAPLATLVLVAVLLLSGCHSEPAPKVAPQPLRIGHTNTPLLAPLYAAELRRAADAGWEPAAFGSGGDIGYALLAGELSSGFVDTDKALQLLKAPGGDKLLIAGAIRFPYGATLVLRNDLKLRLAELSGRNIAALEPDCTINHQFRHDAGRHGLDPQTVRFTYMPYAEMLPALEAKKVDAILVKGAYGVLAELAGHKILYQNWEVAAGDDCCPATLAQTEFLLVARAAELDRVTPVIKALAAADDLPAVDLRAAVATRLGYPPAALERFPVASFALIDEATRQTLGAQQCVIIR
jgi:ABC-type nitrate/sulfonate/bicarbonate transport system substrate-binding protein